MINQSKQKDLSENHVIARAKPVAIFWYIVRILTQYQEIAAPLRARNDRGSIWLLLLFEPGRYPNGSVGS